jgi:hypothetical protein
MLIYGFINRSVYKTNILCKMQNDFFLGNLKNDYLCLNVHLKIF